MNPIGEGPAEKSGPCEFANFSKLTSSPSWFAESQRKVAGGLHGQGTPEKTLSYKESIIIGGNRDMWEYIEIQKIFFRLHAVWAWKNSIRKVKASQDLSLVRDRKGHQKGFYKCLSRKDPVLNKTNKWHKNGQNAQCCLCLSLHR